MAKKEKMTSSMESNFITPIQLWSGVNQTSNISNQETKNTEGVSAFQSIFQNAIQDVKDTSSEYEYQQYLLATGQTDDVHNIPIAAAKAQLSVDLLVQLRTKALESYNELIRTSL